MSKKAELPKLKEKRSQCVATIERIKIFISEHKNDEILDTLIDQLEVRKDNLYSCFHKYQDIEIEILCLSREDGSNSEEVENDYLNIMADINRMISKHKLTKFNCSSSSDVAVIENKSISVAKLPHIDIPYFDGKNLNEFKPFIEIFLAVIDKNPGIQDVEKLFYLRNYLKGEALTLIVNLPIVNASYSEALNILKQRFDNESMLINSHIYSLLDIPNMQKGNSIALREFISHIKQQLGALKNLKQPIESWDMILICILSKKLDQYTNRAYQVDKDNNKLPTLNEFLQFLEDRAIALEAVNLPEYKNKNIDKNKQKSQFTHLATKNKNEYKCQFCSIVGHKIYSCKKFQTVSVKERISFIDKQKHCRVCLNNHTGRCKFSYKCQTCHKDHNTLLHLDKQENTQGDNSENNSVQLFNQYLNGRSDNVLLPTVKVRVSSCNGKSVIARGLIDSCSQTSLITNNLVTRLNSKIYNDNINVMGISENVTKIRKFVNIDIESCTHNFKMNLNSAVVDNITSNLPQISFDATKINIPENILLSDRDYNKSDRIDILLGANVFFNILLNGSKKLGKDGLVLQNTLFGFVVSGSIPSTVKHDLYCNFSLVSLHANTSTSVENLISQFWETEKVPEIYPEYPSDQEACEAIFQSTVEKVVDKFQVCLPLKQSLPNLNLGDSFSVAYKRFENLEKRFKSNPGLFEQYRDFISEYINLGHANIVDINNYDLNSGSVYFMAHHPVIREDKRTTKLRVVFDGSMKTKNKKSLNDLMYNGAVVQNELFDILILFRTFKYVILTDVKQMFRMIMLHPNHKPLQNILWRENSGTPIQCLQLQTVTYGLKSSPFLATRCLVELAHNEGYKFPLAAKALLNNTYVDDILSGGNTIEETEQLKNELIDMLRLGSFELHKWCANDSKILRDIPIQDRHLEEVDINNSPVIKTLGLSYNTISDSFKISSPKIDNNECVTKRQVLSFICKFYDPLGLVGPVLVAAKVIMQKLWINKLNWDDVLPDELLKIWQDFVNSLTNMPVLTIPRNLNFVNAKNIELIGYCDSSAIAFGAVLYVRSIFNDKVYVNLLCSKSRIVPINKKLTIPKLELNSALLLANLTNKIYALLKSKINKVYLYSDSTIVLAWIKTDPVKLSAYVANRIIKIQNSNNNYSWLYINTKDNPADCLSRGLEPQDINSNELWFHGPSMLMNCDYSHTISSFNIPNPLPEQKVQTLVQITNSQDNFLFENFSSITKLQRIVVYMLRFIHNSKNKNSKMIGRLSVSELDQALKTIIKHEQRQYFRDEIKCLNSKLNIKTNLNALSPFIDREGVLRVGGRLQNANISFDQRHPIILPKNNHITNLIIIREHLRLLHAGQRQVLSSLNLKFWIINGTREIKRNIHKCVTCFRLKAQCSQQLMGSLPVNRVTSSRPFQNVGIDFCGPFFIKQSRIRKSVVSKSYVALFVCFSVKAIHMELLSDMTTDNFLASFKRFISRRGKPTQVYCDNGSTFKGAKNQLSEFYKIYNSKEHKNKIECFCNEEQITFNFIPSYSPVFGGLWEAGVKSAKYHIKRVMGTNTQFTYEQFNTIIVQVEGILNSRPITQMSNDPSDLTYLTPGHFLIGAPITSFPEPDLTTVPENRLKFWRLCTQVQQHFWKRWHKDYLTQLQNRQKWRKDLPNVKDGMLVLLKEDNVPSLKWPMARIIKVISGKDNKVRVVKVKTANGEYLRSITKIAVLPIY